MQSSPCGTRPAVRIMLEQLETHQHHRCENLLIGDNISTIFMKMMTENGNDILVQRLESQIP